MPGQTDFHAEAGFASMIHSSYKKVFSEKNAFDCTGAEEKSVATGMIVIRLHGNLRRGKICTTPES